jgi:prephenate dehydrogenase
VQITFVGLGLIGGSIARALRQAPGYADAHLVAWTPSGHGARAALAAGVIDTAAADLAQAIDGAGLLVLAAPPVACAAIIASLGTELRGRLSPGAMVTDVASTKVALTGAARDAGLAYVGGHPMAGRETSGFGAADEALFRGRPWVITEAVGDGDPEVVRGLALACGAVPVELDATRHDRLVAAISHAPLLASVALAEAVTGSPGDPHADWPAAEAIAASGWRDTTRVARGEPTMGAEIAATNAVAIAEVLRRHRDRIDEWIALLEAPGGPDPVMLAARLGEVRARLRGGG